MIVVTGGAGFIGSGVVRCLNDRGIEDIIIVDNIAQSDKWRNMSNKKYIAYYNRNEFLECLPELSGKVTHIFHLGACSSTTERDFDFLYKNNFEYISQSKTVTAGAQRRQKEDQKHCGK